MSAPGNNFRQREQIKELLSHHGAAIGVHPAGAIAVEGPTRTGRYSRIFRAAVPGLATALAVKCVLDPETGEPDRVSARTQFDALDRVHRAMASSSFRVPKPYLLAEPQGVIVIEWIHAKSMTDLLLSWRLSREEARRLMRQAGLWLRSFIEAHRLPPGKLNVEDKLRGIASVEHSVVFRHSSARDAVDALRAYAGPAGSYELERSWVHGDFKTDNLLADGESVVGVDVHVRHENPVVHDVAAFLNHWELTLCHPRAWRWRPWRAELSREFLQSFDASYMQEKRLPYLWTALYVMLGNWEEFINRETRTIQHAYLGRCFSSVVRRMTRELHEAARNGISPVAWNGKADGTGP